MINLLPPNAKKVIKRDYVYRVAAVSFLSLASLFLVSILISIPSWYLLDLSEKAAGTHLSMAEAAKSTYAELANKVTETNKLIKHLENSLSEPKLANLVSELDDLSGSSISITEFIFNPDGKVSLSGIADSRSDLSVFRDGLAADERFSGIDLPLSSLARDKDTPFTITFFLVSDGKEK